MKILKIIFALALTPAIAAQSALADKDKLSESFPIGSGAQFELSLAKDEMPATLLLSVADVRDSSQEIEIEYFVSSPGFPKPIELWQHFIFKKTDQMKVTDGFISTRLIKEPRRLPQDMLKASEGSADLNEFLFMDEKRAGLGKKESISVLGGTTEATKYNITSNGQTIEFWLSNEAKPFGLVKLISSGKEKKNNYTIELKSLVKNVSPKIKPSSDIKLLSNDEAKSLGLK